METDLTDPEPLAGYVSLWMHTRSMTKTISLSDDAYASLERLKKPGESFSDVALRLARTVQQAQIIDYAGAWEMDEEEADAFKRAVYEAREGTREPPVEID